jgi:hypothetical protein
MEVILLRYYYTHILALLMNSTEAGNLLLRHFYIITTSLLHVPFSLLHGHFEGLLLLHYYHYYMNSLLPSSLLPLLPLLPPPTWRCWRVSVLQAEGGHKTFFSFYVSSFL